MWNEYGWSQKLITTNWKWENGYWVKGNTIQKITMLNANLCDGTHPHTDLSGDTNLFIAKHIALFLNNHIPK